MQRHVDGWSCSEVLDLLESWVDGELGEAETGEMKAHVDRCAECRVELELVERIASELRSLAAFDLPDRVAHTARRRARGSLWTRFGEAIERLAARPLPALVAVVALVLMVVVLAPWRGPGRPQFSDHEVARATTETKLALAYVASATRRVERRVTHTILEDGIAGRTVRRYRQTIHSLSGPASVATEPRAAPSRTSTNQGS